MIEFFRRNLFINSLLILPYILIIRLDTFIHADKYIIEYEGYNVVLSLLYDTINHPFAQSIFSSCLLFFQAIYINRIAIKNRISRELTLFAGIIYIILLSLSPELAKMSPALIANTFILLMVSQLFKTYKNPKATINIFNSGFFASIAFIFNPIYLILFLFGLIGFTTLRSFKNIERLQYTSGFLVPIFLSFSLLYYFEYNIGVILSEFWNEFGLFSFKSLISIGLLTTLGIYLIIFLINFISYNKYTVKKSIQSQKKVDLLYWLALFSLFTVLFHVNPSLNNLLILAIPISILFSMNLSTMKNKLSTEFIHLFLLAIMVLNYINIQW